MGKRTLVKIRINRDRLEVLYSMCTDMLEEFKPGNEHQQLLREYLEELHQKLHKKMATSQWLYTLNMSNTETIAFQQIWKLLDIKHDKYATIIIDALIRQMKKYSEATGSMLA